ncbi:hypothetical protein T261_2208 [Streptomyces lydicus]|nr:hypothetical protein T261_2208 [Streptomyces lydicus]
MAELILISLPGKGSGFTLRQPSRWLRPDYVEFLGGDGRVWLFREISYLQDFLASGASAAPRWRDLVQTDGRELEPDQAERYNLWQMVDGTLRWGPGDEAWPCSELCIELAFYCDSSELLGALGPDIRTRDVKRWRHIIPIVGSLVRFWGEGGDGPIDLDAISWSICESYLEGP